MSGRIRTIKPELLEDDLTAGLSHEAFRLFVSMLLLADDYGNMRANPAYLAGAVFWARPSREGVSKLLEDLGALGLLVLYEVRGQPYAHVAGWDKHQRVDHPGKPRVPAHTDPEAMTIRRLSDDSRGSRECPANVSRGSREGLATDHDPDPDQEEEKDLVPASAVTVEPLTLKAQEPEEPKPKKTPLPWKREDVFAQLERASKGRFVPGRLKGTVAIEVNKALRELADEGATLEDFTLVGEWVASWGVDAQIDASWVARTADGKGLRPALPKARAWAARGKPTQGKAGSSAPEYRTFSLASLEG